MPRITRAWKFEMIGREILHYKILEKIGEGGMGIVYKASDNELKREVAIKFLPSQIASRKEERERFKIEAQAAAALNHPNIATIHAIEQDNNDLFLVMEFIEGQELRDIVKAQDAMPLSEVVNTAIQIGEGLQAAHERGVTHRDINQQKSTSDGERFYIVFNEQKSDIWVAELGQEN